MSSCCVAFQHTGMDCNLQLLLMEIDLHEEESTETSKFINFSIREYVDEICNKNPEKCWPFRSLDIRHKSVVSSYQSSEPTFLSGHNCPSEINESEDTTEQALIYNIESLGIDSDLGKIEDNGSSELTSCKVNDGHNRHENHVDKGAKIGHNVAADNNEQRRNRPRRKHKKFRLLSDIYKDPASELRAGYDRTNPVNVNRKFVTEIDDELDDDVTLAAYFRKQIGVEVTDSTLKKRNITGVEEPSVDPDRKPNHGSKNATGKDSMDGITRKKSRSDETDTQTMPDHNKDVRLQRSPKSNRFAEVSSKEAAEKEKEKEKEKENEDSEMQAVMLLARHFNDEKQILHAVDTNMTYARVKKKIRGNSTQSGNKPIAKTSSKTARKHAVKKINKVKLENAFCSVQMRSFTPVKATPNGVFQSDIKMSMTKAAEEGPYAQNCATLVCSINMNPADFSTPNGENRFMRGG